VYEEQSFKKGETIEYSREARGGTNFNKPTDYANENEFDMLVIITDMCATAPKPCRIPRIWITDPRNFDNHFQTNEVVLCLETE
jgi:predicted metal-dependent peptidase